MLDSPEQEFKFDGIIMAVAHDAFKEDGKVISLEKLETIMNSKPVLIDVPGCFDGRKAQEKGFYYRTL